LQGAGNPESVSAGFETDNDPRDLKTRLSRFPLRLLKRPNDRLDVARREASFRPPRQPGATAPNSQFLPLSSRTATIVVL
jgi:hypothetical protein